MEAVAGLFFCFRPRIWCPKRASRPLPEWHADVHHTSHSLIPVMKIGKVSAKDSFNII